MQTPITMRGGGADVLISCWWCKRETGQDQTCQRETDKLRKGLSKASTALPKPLFHWTVMSVSIIASSIRLRLQDHPNFIYLCCFGSQCRA